MKLKNLYHSLFPFLLLLWLTQMNTVFAFYTKGDTLYVLARKGLNMRAMPNNQATLIKELAYGTLLVITNDSIFDAYQIEDIKNFYIQGNWVNVCDKNNTCGYVFDGYLSKFIAPPLKYEIPESEDNRSEIGYYFKKFMKLKPQRTILAKHKNCKEKIYADYCIYKWKETFGEYIVCETTDYDSGNHEIFKFTNASLKDIYLLSKIWLLMHNDKNDPMNTCINYDKINQKIYFHTCEEGTGCYYTLKQEADTIILEGYCGC